MNVSVKMLRAKESNHKENNEKGDKTNRITFKDVAGQAEAKQEVEEIVEFLKHTPVFLGADVNHVLHAGEAFALQISALAGL